MKLESEYLKHGFKKHRLKLKWYHILILPFILFFVGITLSFLLPFTNQQQEYTGILMFYKHVAELHIEFIFLLFLSYVFSWFLYNQYKKHSLKKPIVVSVEFKDKEKKLILKTRMLFKCTVHESVIPYANLRVKKIKNLYDPISNAKYKGIFIYNLKNRLGVILKNHFSWHPIWYEKIANKLYDIN